MLESLNQKNLYRGPASSREFNERNQLIRNDIAQMYHTLNENEEQIEKNMEVVLRENFFLNYEIENLKREVDKLKGLLSEDENPTGPYSRQVFIQNFYTTNNIFNRSQDRLTTINKEYGIAMPLSTNMISRFGYQTDKGEVFVPNSLEVHIREGNDTRMNEFGEVILEGIPAEDFSAIVDRNKNTFWIRTVNYPTHEAIHEVYGEIHLIIPTEGFQNIYSNTLKIVPYPEGSMRIHDIQYKGYNEQWSRLSTYPLIDGEPKVINNAHKLFFNFPETEMIELKIMFSQPYWFENENKSQFTYGFQDISLEYHSYTEKNCEFITTINLEEDNTYFKKVLEPIVMPAEGTTQDLTDMVQHELYYDKDLTTQFTFGTDILADVNQIYIKTLLKRDGRDIPVLKEIQIPYLYDTK